ncbi:MULTISPECIES: glycoside hydrolase family 19 protein [unclassified Streptomyces]|uniref:glycoside hydrolase family 19 protein n=1 Tax=unclassified Streptomyces TaxID=2593676 RepID=UPI002E811F38|nr:glycoside hydrolase family 19 protein [Streptomyces sp. NBC_00562]WUC21276.1 chitinase [Streptomyces sp. NBC_00562]
MMRRVMGMLATLGAVVAMLVVLPASTASAAECAAPWNASSVYTGGGAASYNGHNWTAKWWTQNERPGSSDVWADQGSCGGGTDPGTPSGFVVSEAQFNQMFPSRNPFYTYSGLTAALSAYPGFANAGSDTVKRQEAAAFLANVSHETGGLVYVVEQNTANYPHYCDTGRPYGCPAGQSAYYGRGPIQLSWNFNYKAAGDALGIDLLGNPYLVEQNASVAWKTGLWYWNTQNGPGTMTAHNAMVNGAGFGETIRSINGSLECNGGNPAQVQSRIDRYRAFVQILGTTPGSNLSC